MSKIKNLVTPMVAITALVGALGIAASAPAQASSPERPARINADGNSIVHFQGKITAVNDGGNIDVATNGKVVKVDHSKAYWVSPLRVGAWADVTASEEDGVYIAKVVVSW
ncbi:hypothetical protein [Streptomyces sp. HD]|uniref:hypothetical protein n=1 Tax=Streptomyces sp. HD TaxID=3020892 RepID=UPI0023310E75|nr:hypothetical protein [Streptomyces sp. HD]MDC0771416.1 hypothetical protein [Streptomyces sp. HD]